MIWLPGARNWRARPWSSVYSSSPMWTSPTLRRAVLRELAGDRRRSREARVYPCAHRRALFPPYGGYSPNPLIFLAAASQRTRTMRLVTGAVLPVFNHPLKLAGEIGMLDAISGGRLDVGFARAFLPHEFRRFGISPDESHARFARASSRSIAADLRAGDPPSGAFIRSRTSRRCRARRQQPRPKFYVAARRRRRRSNSPAAKATR